MTTRKAAAPPRPFPSAADAELSRFVAEHVPDIVWTADVSGAVDYVNERWGEVTGLPAADAGGNGWEAAIHPDDLPHVQHAWALALSAGTNHAAEMRLRARDGTYRWYLVRALPRRNADGTIAAWVGTGTDVDELKQSQAELERTTSRYMRLADAVPQLIDITRSDGRLEYANATWLAYVGAARPEAVGRPWVDHVHPDDRAGLHAVWAAAVAEVRGFETRIRLRAADGTYRWFLNRGTPMPRRDGTIGSWIAASTDIDAQVRSEAVLALLSDLSDVLTAPRDQHAMLGGVAELVVARCFADAVRVYVKEGDALRVPAVAHREVEKEPVLARLVRQYPLTPARPAWRSVERGEVVFIPHLGEQDLAGSDRGYRALIEELKLTSAIVVPLLGSAGVLGALSFSRDALSKGFVEGDVRTAELIAKRVALALENLEQRRQQQHVVDSFQRAALPKTLPNLPGLVLDAVYEPAVDGLAVGGDWYDAFPLPDGRLVLTVGDVAGKGLDAAVSMASTRQSIRVAALQGLEPGETLRVADAALALSENPRYTTAFVAVIDPQTWSISYASAGHPAPLVRRPDGSLLPLDAATSIPLGADPSEKRPSKRVLGVPAGSLMVLYTDGLVESTRDYIEGERRLHDALGNDAVLHSAMPAHLIRDIVLHEAARDDVAILTLALGRQTHWSFDAADALAAQTARAAFVAALAREAAPDADLASAELIFGELVGNVVRYAPGSIEIDLEWTAGEPILHVIDRGPGFDLDSSLPEDIMSERGRGLFIVAALGTDLRADTLATGRGNHVRVRLPVHRRDVS